MRPLLLAALALALAGCLPIPLPDVGGGASAAPPINIYVNNPSLPITQVTTGSGHTDARVPIPQHTPITPSDEAHIQAGEGPRSKGDAPLLLGPLHGGMTVDEYNYEVCTAHPTARGCPELLDGEATGLGALQPPGE